MEAAVMQDPYFVTSERHGSQVEKVDRKIGHVQAVRVGKTLYISGAVRWSQDSGVFAEDDMRAQMRNAFGDIRRMLEVHGATVADIVKETVYTKNIEAAIEAKEIRSELYGNCTSTAKWVGVSRLLYPELLVEIGIIAKLP